MRALILIWVYGQARLAADSKLQLIETLGAELDCPVDIVDLYHAMEPITGQVFKGIRLIGSDTAHAAL
ncbi:MAG: hypothetical protein KBA82_10375 [Nitrosomonas sp.]|nr:hypothetical protein [Nitrosomonas sp.]MBP7113355.1 hypothetical protein [Nitrosomonas sp.]